MRCAFSIAAVVLFVSSIGAIEPTLRGVNIRGLQIGGTTTIAIDGDDLGKSPQLLFTFRAKAILRPGNTDKLATFDVMVDSDVAPGYYHLRVVTDGGVSLPVVIAVDRLQQRPIAASADQMPIALHGSVSGSNTAEIKFQGKAGQKVMVEVEAQRLGSKLRPIVHLISPKKLQLAWAWGVPALFGDARLETHLPEDGTYAITVHDTEYAAPAPSYFRLRIGQWSFVDQVFPPALAKGQAQRVELIGPGSPLHITTHAPLTAGLAAPIPWPDKSTWSGPRAFVSISSHPELTKTSDANKAYQELPAGPVGVSGRLLASEEEDRYRVPTTPGTKIKLEVFAERLGSPLDVALVVRNEKGNQLARTEDSPGTLDPTLEYAVPDRTTAIVVGVVESAGRTGPRGGIYRLVVEPQAPGALMPSCRLTTAVQRISVPAGGRAVVPVFAERRGYAGQLDLVANSKSIQFEGATIPDGADGTLVTVSRNGPTGAEVLEWHGRGAKADQIPVVVQGHPMQRLQPWLANEIAIAPTSFKAADFQIDWTKLPSDAAIVPGMKLALPIKVMRANPKTMVKLTLLTSQLAPLVNNQPDPNKSIRQEKPIELGDKASEAELTALLPGDLASSAYDMAIQGELLTPDKKSVLATAYTSVRRLAVKAPLVVQLTGPDRIEVVLDGKKGATVNMQARVAPIAGVKLKGEPALVVSGVPPGTKVEAKPSPSKEPATDFAINLVMPPNVAAGEYRVKLSASSDALELSQAGQRIKSKEIELTLVVKTAPTK